MNNAPDRLSEIEGRLTAATPGHHQAVDAFGYLYIVDGDGDSIVEIDNGRWDDIQMYAHAPDDLRYLLDRVRQLEAALRGYMVPDGDTPEELYAQAQRALRGDDHAND